MRCLPCCFKPSTSEDHFVAEPSHVIRDSQHEADIQRATQLSLEIHDKKQLDLAIQESSRLRQQEEEEERRRTRELENDAQIANGLRYEERERQINNKIALEDVEDEHLAMALEESLKENSKKQQLEEQVKTDEQLAVIVQESLDMVESPPRLEENYNISTRAPLDEDVQRFGMAFMDSLKEKGKGKQFEDEQVKKDEQLALIVQESLNMVESPPRLEENNNISTRASLDEDEQLAKVVEESLKGKGQIKQSKDEVEEDGKLLKVNIPPSKCGGCNFAVEHGGSVNILGVLWHPGCFCCRACDKPIAIHDIKNHVSNSRGKFHKYCYERYCSVCQEKKMKTYNQLPFWEERYCPAHDADGTPKCCSCERLEPQSNCVMLADSRWLCLECMNSAVMDSHECQPLHFEMREFFEGLNMKIEKEFPFLLVEKQALNKAEKEEKIDYQYEVVTRGICLSEEQIVDSVSQKPHRGPNNKLIGMATEPQKVVRKCEVTAILILYGFPRLLTGYILAHEMMHAYLRLNGHRNLNNILEEGLCQVLGHMWLESQTYATDDATADASSASSSRTPAASASKKGEWSDFEKKLVEFCKNQIETDDSPVYGVGFRTVNEMVTNTSLQETLKEILRWG